MAVCKEMKNTTLAINRNPRIIHIRYIIRKYCIVLLQPKHSCHMRSFDWSNINWVIVWALMVHC